MAIAALPEPELPQDTFWHSTAYKNAYELFQKQVMAKNIMHDKTRWVEGMRYGMSCAHAGYLENIRRVYVFADYAAEHDDLADYLGFADIAFAAIDEHHHFEETEVFPLMAKCLNGEDAMAVSAAEHATFTSGLDAAWIYVRACREALSPAPPKTTLPGPDLAHIHSPPPTDVPPVELKGTHFDPALLRRQMDTWLPAMVTHLGNEVKVLTDDLMRRVGEQGWNDFVKMLDKHLKALDPTLHACSTVGSYPMSAVGEFMALPLIVRRGLVPLVWAGKYWGYWKYLAYPQNLTFAGSRLA